MHCGVFFCMEGIQSPGLPSALAVIASLDAASRARELAKVARAGGQVHTRNMRVEYIRSVVACVKWRRRRWC